MSAMVWNNQKQDSFTTLGKLFDRHLNYVISVITGQGTQNLDSDFIYI